ncbi:MAG: SbcC/MukB-like Walker B domain-containing protein [Lachnospiraceae bacterium]
MKQSKKIFTKMCLTNWGGMAHKVIEFNEYVNLFSGKSGSGKSTVMDAIQVLLYGSLSSKFLNKAADDAKNRRSVLSYLRGEQKDGTVNREHQDFYSHLVLEIQDTGTQSTTCIGMAFEVGRNDMDVKKNIYFSHSGKIPDSEYFTMEHIPFSCEEMKMYVQGCVKSQEYYGKGNVNRTYPSKESYLSTLYDVILGYIDGKRFVTMEQSAIALKMTKGTGTFIRDYMFPKSTENTIEKISEQLGAYRDIKEKVDDLEKRISILNEIQEKNKECQLNEIDIMKIETMLNCVDIEDIKGKLQAWEEEFSHREEQLIQKKAERENLEEEKEEKRKELLEVESNLKSSDYGEKKKRLQEIEASVHSLEFQSREWREILQKLRMWETDEVVTDFVSNRALQIMEEFRKGTVTIAQCEQLRKAITEVKENIEEELIEVNKQKTELHKELNEKKIYAEDIRNNRKTYSSILREAKAKLSRKLSDRYGVSVQVSVFADLFDVKEEEWKNAVEGRMSRLKISLITEPQYAHEAAVLFRQMKEYEEVDLINSAAIAASQPKEQTGSLYEAVTTDKPYVDACLKRYLGRIIKCHSVEELEQVHDGVTMDCYSYSNFIFSHLRAKSYTTFACIGRKVSKAKLAELEADIKKLEKEYGEIVQTAARLASSRMFESLSRGNEVILHLSQGPKELDKKLCEKKKLEELLKQLENGEILKLQQKKLFGEKEIERLKGEIYCLNEQINEDNTKKIHLEDKISYEKEELEKKLLGYAANEEIETEVQMELKKQSGNVLKTKKSRELEQLREKQEEYETGRVNARQKFNKNYPNFGFSGLERKNELYDHLLEQYQNDYEPEYQKEFQKQCDMVQKSLRDNVIASIHGEIKAAMRHRDEINRLLRDTSFSDSTYQIEVKQSDTETGQFYEMLMAKELDSKVIDNKGYDGQMSFGEESFLQKYRQKIDLLTEKFTPARNSEEDKVVTHKKKEMELYADYRNYLSFSMYERVIDEKGKERKNYVDDMAGRDSGGEGQNPKYVALLAGFAMLYMQQSNRDSRIKLVLLDEAFSKMDQERSEVCLKYARKLELQLIVCVPDERLQSLIQHVDCVYGFRRDQNQTTMMHIDKGQYLKMIEGSEERTIL